MNDSIDCHIHLQVEKAEELLLAMDHTHTQKAILLGSSKFTFTLNPNDGFNYYHNNNLELLLLKSLYPDRFEVWPTLDPLYKDNCNLFKKYFKNGASGLKLYVGHGYAYGKPSTYLFHTTPINSNALMEVYEFCSNHQLPICLHVNTTNNAPGFREEFEIVLSTFPKLKIIAPHWMLAARRPSFLRKMFGRYDNLWTDTSFGQDSFFEAGMKYISDNNKIIKAIISDFSDRILCGSDIVCTKVAHKTVKWMSDRIFAYKLMLSENTYPCPVTGLRRNGLSLSPDILSKVLKYNAVKILSVK